MTLPHQPQDEAWSDPEARIAFIEQALKRDPCREYRRELVREYLALTEPQPKEIEF